MGVLSLEACWREWTADCKPELCHSLFAEALQSVAAEKVEAKLSNNGTLVVIADSRVEGLAFLDALFSNEELGLQKYKDRIGVFTEHGVLAALAAKNLGIIPVVASPVVERELAPHKDAH